VNWDLGDDLYEIRKGILHDAQDIALIILNINPLTLKLSMKNSMIFVSPNTSPDSLTTPWRVSAGVVSAAVHLRAVWSRSSTLRTISSSFSST